MDNRRDSFPPRRLMVVLVALAVIVGTPLAVSAASSFTDVPDTHIFSGDIQWMADAGVTKGCNPPTNDRFCPDGNVTRGQMAAFMHRLADSQEVDAGSIEGLTASELQPFVYTTRVEGPTEITGNRDFQPVASLDLPAGTYLVQAKAYFWGESATDGYADCRLITENVVDDVWVDIAAEEDSNQAAAAFLAVDELTADTTVTLSCRDGDRSVVARDVVIVATVLSGYSGDI